MSLLGKIAVTLTFCLSVSSINRIENWKTIDPAISYNDKTLLTTCSYICMQNILLRKKGHARMYRTRLAWVRPACVLFLFNF